MLRLTLALALCSGLWLGGQAQEPRRPTTLLVGGVVDPVDRTVSSARAIVVRGATIESITEIPAAPEGDVIDLRHLTVMPGLIDAHTHLCIRIRPERDDGEYLVLDLFDPPGYRAIQGAAHAREMLEAGFTTVRDAGNAGPYLDLDLKRAIGAGLVPGPTIVAAGRIIAPFGGQHYLGDMRDDDQMLRNAEYLTADTRDEMTKAVRANAYHGVDFIKIVVDAHRYGYSREDIAFIVAEAARAGLRVAAHAQSPDGARRAAEAGVASIEHGWSLPADVLAVMKEKSVVLVSTDFTVEVLEGFGWPRERAAAIHERRVARLRDAARAGVPLAFGSDIMVAVAGKTRGQAAAAYVTSYLEAGVEPWEILRAFTTGAARLLGVDGARGRLAPGLAADLVGVPGNPARDPRLLERAAFVMREGVVIRR